MCGGIVRRVLNQDVSDLPTNLCVNEDQQCNYYRFKVSLHFRENRDCESRFNKRLEPDPKMLGYLASDSATPIFSDASESLSDHVGQTVLVITIRSVKFFVDLAPNEVSFTLRSSVEIRV